MIQINSYKNVNGLAFGSSEAEAISIFGLPIRQAINREQEKELCFSDHTLRFDAKSGELREVSLLPQCSGAVNGKPVSWDEGFFDWLKTQDGDLKEVLGFVLSLKLGIALSGFHDNDESQKAIHAFRYGDWDMFKNRMHPLKQ
ncbi:hypothetical protein GJ699_29890 [Duganella sp. FT80W]|uniref:Uncharacterized protein n=1 Tax=Duganella guangzhouensis TaxID=2666084 RepID=A0A6I2L8K4_9BURK|nr:hypothetical protein [Duganella guangzhouensis]MRW94193.1 hypothetical protein [Duganella guangzhouensis]